MEGSEHNKKAKELIEKYLTKVEIIKVSTREELAALAMDAFYFGGPKKLPALYIPKEGKWYEGLEEIKQKLDNIMKNSIEKLKKI